jgi:arylsulfatase A-like enzyme
MTGKPPNILILTADQMRAEHVGYAGNPVIRTPHLDSLAGEGVQFERAYVNCPLCMPSRATLFTGLSPRGHGVRTNGIPLSTAIPTLPGLLRKRGYRTASIGKIHLSNYELYPDRRPEAGPEAFPELRENWLSGRTYGAPTPYYGLEHVELTVGHGAQVEGDYARWLREQHPEQWRRLQQEAPRPSPRGAEGCATFPLDEEYHHTAYVANQTIGWLRGAAGDEPFFLLSSFPDPHHPYVAPEPWDRMYDPDEVIPPVGRPGELDELHPHFRDIYENDLWVSGRRRATRTSEEHLREIIAYTYGMVSLLDKHVGRVIAELERLGLRERTVVLFLSDHGDLMGDHGLLNKGPFHFEGLLRVPLIWSWPGRFPPRRSRSLASLLDVVPTMLELAGVDYPSETGVPGQLPPLPGRSLLPLLQAEQETVQESVVVENDEDYLGLRLRTIVAERYKLTSYTGAAGEEAWGELFDLQEDPSELHNLWNDPASSAIRAKLTRELHHELVRTDSVLTRRLGHA